MFPTRAYRWSRFAVAACLVACVSAAVHNQPAPAPVLQRWLDAGEAHIPGQADEPALAVGDWEKDQLLWILNHVDQAPSPHRALMRGAVLHLDIALQIRARATGRLFRSYPRTAPAPPPVTALVVDGTGAGSGASSTHLELARALVQKITPPAAPDEFARRWYVASAAQLAQRQNFAELQVHLQHARRLVEDDPEILLASGCLRESFAAPLAQAAARQRSIIVVGTRDDNLRRAERFFRDALARAPELAEARLRLGRVLGLQEKHQEALVELQRTLDLTNDRAQTYYALLFLGRSEEALGRLEAARGYFERASTLYPSAQSPRLALSRLALERGEDRQAQRVLEAAIDRPSAHAYGRDPWWEYGLGPGRYAEQKQLQLHLALQEGTR